MKKSTKFFCGIALAILAMGAGVAAISHVQESKAAFAEVVSTEPVSVLHLDQTKIKGYDENHYETMTGHTGSEITAYVFSADGDCAVNPEIRFVTEGTEGSTKVAYGSAVTTARFWYKLTNTSEKNVADGDFPYLLQVLDSEGTYPLINWQPVVDGEWHSWCMEVPETYQSRFAGFVVKMGDINGSLVVADIELNVTAEANEVGYFDVTKFSSWHCFTPDNKNEMLLMQTTGTDYPSASDVYNLAVDVDKINAVGFADQMKAVNSPFNDLIGGQSYLNYWVRPGLLTFMPASSQDITQLNLPKGLRIPSYNYFKNGVPTYYSLIKDYKVTRINPTHEDIESVWAIEVPVDDSLVLGDFTITQIQSYHTYGGPENANEQVLVWVSGTDYVDVDGAASMQQKIADAKFPNTSAHVIYGDPNDETVVNTPNIIAGEYYHNFTTRHPLFSFAPEAVANVDKIVFTEGLLIPSYSYISGGAESYYRLKTDYTATRLEHNTAQYDWNNWSVIKTGPAEKLGNLTFNSLQWCGHSNEGWGYNKVFIIIKFNETSLESDYNNYNIDNSAYVSEDYYLNKIKVNGKFLSEYDGSTLLESFRANAIGMNQFAIIFDATFDDVYNFELLPGCRLPSANKVDYFEVNQHLIKSVHSSIFDAAQLDSFGANFMHPEIETSETGTGQCTTEGWYAAAKAEYMGWDEYKRAVMYDYREAYYGWVLDRLAAWAAANGDVLSGWNIVQASSSHSIISMFNDNYSAILVITICASFSLMIVGLFFVIRKRKTDR